MPATYEPIASTTLSTTSVGSVSFNSIPGTYTDLVLVTSLRDTANARSDDIWIRFNGSSSTEYSRTYFFGDGAGAGSGRQSSTTFFAFAYVPANTAPANLFSSDITHIMSYANTSVFKTALSVWGDSGVATGRTVGLWRNTSAITSLQINCYTGGSLFAAGSTFSLYGIKAA